MTIQNLVLSIWSRYVFFARVALNWIDDMFSNCGLGTRLRCEFRLLPGGLAGVGCWLMSDAGATVHASRPLLSSVIHPALHFFVALRWGRNTWFWTFWKFTYSSIAWRPEDLISLCWCQWYWCQLCNTRKCNQKNEQLNLVLTCLRNLREIWHLM